MTEAKYEEIEALRAERRNWEQILRQTEGDLTAYGEGWRDSAAYKEVGELRDRCREEMWAIDVKIAGIEGEDAPARPERAAQPTPERVGDVEDATADLSEVVSGNASDVSGLSDAVAELSQLVSDMKTASTSTGE